MKGSYGVMGLWASNVPVHQHHLEVLLKHGCPDPTPRVSDFAAVGWSQECAVLISSQVILAPLVQGPHSENHGNRSLFLTLCSVETRGLERWRQSPNSGPLPALKQSISAFSCSSH